MSINFECRGKTLWFPANGVGRLFLSQVADLEARVGSPSGLRAGNSSDDVDVDAADLDAFMHCLANLNISHPSLLLLLRGVCVHLLALRSCIGAIPQDVASHFPDDWTTEAKELAVRFPT
jgi:uncharacterized protein DUF6086